MEQITFTGATLEAFSRNRKSGGHAKFTAPLTKPVMTALGLDNIPDWSTSLDAGEVDLSATQMVMRAKEGDLANYETTVGVSEVSRFEVTRLETKGKRGKGSRLELSFVVKFADATGCAFLEEHMLSAGPCNLSIAYERKAKQLEIPDDVHASDEQRQAGLEIH